MEVIVAASLLVLLVGILTRFFQIAYRISHEELERNSVEASLLNLTTKLQRDLSTAAAPGLSLSANQQSLLIHPVVLTDVGTVAFQPKLVLWTYNPGLEQVRRRTSESVTGVVFDGTAYRAPEATLALYPASTDFQNTLILKNIAEFEFSTNPDVPPPFIGSPIKLNLKAKLEQSGKEIELTKVFHLRNSG